MNKNLTPFAICPHCGRASEARLAAQITALLTRIYFLEQELAELQPWMVGAQ